MKRNSLILLFVFLLAVFIQAEGANTTNANGIGTHFPSFTARALDDNNITIPDQVSPKVEIAVLSFSRQDLQITDSWINTPAAINNGNPAFAYYEVAVIPDMPLLSGVILNSIKGSIPKRRWDNFLIYSGDKDAMMKKFSVGDTSFFYVYVIGKDGLIKWMEKSAKPSEEDIKIMTAAIENELRHSADKNGK